MDDDKPKSLYIMQNQDGLIKIGVSNDPERRRLQLQGLLSDSISILKILEYPKFEKDIHKIFKEYNARYKGQTEWFTPYPDIIKWVDSVDDNNFEKLYNKLCQKKVNTRKKI